MDIPKNRNPDHYYAFLLGIASQYARRFENSETPRFFNLTFTYRRDSSVPFPCGDFTKAPIAERNGTVVPPENLTDIFQGKTKMVAWFVSNCEPPSRRQEFVKNLKQYLRVDVYGWCGDLKCPRQTNDLAAGIHDATGRHRMLTKDYKFYLSLENAICRDYVTEKFYTTMDDSIVIPIIFERNLLLDTVKDEETKKKLNKSIIAVDDFPNVAALASYMKYLDENITAYMEYFEWRKDFKFCMAKRLKKRSVISAE